MEKNKMKPSHFASKVEMGIPACTQTQHEKVAPLRSFLMSFTFVFLMHVAPPAHAATIAQVAVDETGTPFLLDDEGHVWAFQEPGFGLPVRLPNLEHVKKIAPYIAFDANGDVYTWLPDEKNTKRDEEGNLLTRAFTSPSKVDILHGATLIASSSAGDSDFHYQAIHFVAVAEGKDMFDWMVDFDRASGFASGRPIRKVSSDIPVKSVAAAVSDITIRSGLGNYTNDAAGSMVALFIDGTVRGWGINEFGQTITTLWNTPITPAAWKKEKEEGEKGVLLTRSPGATEVAMDTGHVVILSSNGTPQYWGGCAFLSDGYSPLMGTARGVKGNIDGAAHVSIMSTSILHRYDHEDADIYIKGDGSVWVVYAPLVPSVPGYCLGATTGAQKSWRASLGGAPALQVSRFLVLDADHKLWLIGRMHYEKNSLAVDPNARLLPSPSREISITFN